MSEQTSPARIDTILNDATNSKHITRDRALEQLLTVLPSLSGVLSHNAYDNS